MAHFGKKPLRLRSKGKLQEEYQKLDKPQSKTFYHEILNFVKNSIIEGDITEFRKYVELLESVHKLEKTKRNRHFLTEGSWIEKTNILLIVCQYERPELLKLVISNYCNVLYLKSTQQLISPIDEDEYGKNAYYYLIRTSNVELLEQLIEKWPNPIEKDQLDLALSKSYSRLVLQNVELSDSMKFFIEYTLSKLRLSESILGNICASQPTLEEIKSRSRLITSTINSLLDSYGGQSPLQIDEKFEFSLKFLTQNIHVLKRLLRCTYNRLPWEEMEFSLIIFITNFKSTTKTNFFYKSYIQRENLLKFLQEFGVHLQNVSDSLEEGDLSTTYIDMDREAVAREISERSSVFKELYKVHSEVRDFHTIETIIDHLNGALESNELKVKANDSFERDLIVQKCVLLVWESMKTSLTSPNLSIPLSNMLWACFSEKLQNIFMNMEIILENELGVSLESIIRKHFTAIEASLEEILNISTDLHIHMQFQRIYELVYEFLQNADWEKIENLKKILDFKQIAAKDYTEKKFEVKMFLLGIKIELGAVMDSKLDFLLNELVQLLEHDEQQIETREACLKTLAKLMENSTDTVCNLLTKAKHIFQPRCMSNIEILTGRFSFDGASYQTKIMKNINQILHYISAKGCDNTINITKLKYFVSPFLAVKSEDQKSGIPKQKDTAKLFKKNVRESPCLTHILLDKIEKLKMILDRCGIVNHRTSLKHFILFKGRTETFSKVEMLLFDILTILQSDLLPNPNLYDLPVPLLMGAELRNYLKWGDSRNLVKTLDCNVKLCVVAQCVVLVNQPSILTMTIRQLPFTNDVESNWNYNIHVIQKKMEFFELLGCERNNDHHEKEVDMLSRNYDNSSSVHIAIQKGDKKALKNIIAAGKKERNLLEDRANRLQQNILHVAAQYCTLEDLKVLLKEVDSKILLSQVDIEWKTPLHYASCHATPNMILKLLECYPHGALVEDKKGYRPIHMAIKSNNIPAFKVLLDAEEDINNSSGSGNQTLLHVAAEAKCEDISELIIDRGADVNLVNRNDNIPLHFACASGSYNIVKMLVNKGSDVNAEDKHGAIPVCYAAQAGHLDIVKFLLMNNADIHTESLALHYAMWSGSIDIINEILRNGVDINALDLQGNTPLNLAIILNKFDAVETLLKSGANVDLADNEDVTPLAHAILAGNEEIIELLLSYNSRWDARNAFASPSLSQLRIMFSILSSDDFPALTSVHLALILGEIRVLKLMMAKGVVLNKAENWEMAVRSESIDTVRIVFDNCHPNYIRQNLRELNDALYTALRMGSGAIAKYLINLGAAIDYSYDMLPFKTLHYAALNCDSEVMKLIIEKGVRQKRGDEIFEILEECWALIAHSKGAVELAKLFMKHGKIKTCRILLRNSVHSNNIELIMMLIESGLSIDLESVFYTIKKGNTVTAKVILEHSKIEINSKNSLNMTLLHVVAKHCDCSFIEYLVSKGAQVNSTSGHGWLPIEYAAMSGNHRSVEVLLKNGAKLGRSMRIAVEEDNARLLSVLIENNGNVDHIDSIGSALHLAIYENSESCSYLLLDRGKSDVNSLNPDKSTPLHLAAVKGNVLLTKILVAMNADIEKPDGKGNKPLHNAVRKGQLGILTFYVELNRKNLGDTLLHELARTCHTELVQCFLRKNFDVNAKDCNGETALHIAARSSPRKMCETLIENGAYYNIKNRVGMSPGDVATTKTKEYFVLLHSLFDMAENQRNASKFSAFIESNQHKICLNTKSEDGRSLLHIAVGRGSLEVVQKLLRYNANVNVVDSELNTPLHYAAKSNNLRIVKALLSAGAIYNIKNIQSKTPYNLSNNPKVKHLLLTIDRCFKCVADKSLQVCKIIQDAGDFEERKMVAFGARNDHNQSIYSYIVTQGLTEIQKVTELILNRVEALEWNTASKLKRTGRFEEASFHMRRIISRFESLYGKSNPLVLNVRKDFALTLYAMDQYKECFEMNADLTKRLKEVYGEDSDQVARQRIFSVFVLSLLDENRKVISMLEEMSIKHLKIDETENGFVENIALTETLIKLEWYDEALTINTEARDACQKKYNENSTETLEVLSKRAHIFREQENLPEAYNYLNFIHMKCNKTHMLYLWTLENLSGILFEMGHISEGITKLETLYEICERSRGLQDPRTLKIKEKMMLMYAAKKDYEAAKKISDDIYPKLRRLHQNDIEEQIKLLFFQDFLSAKILESSSRRSTKQEQKRQVWTHGDLIRAITDENTEKVSKILQTDKSLINGVDKNGATPLHIAANVNSTAVLAVLIEAGADLFASTKNRNSILHTAANRGSISAVKTILDHINQKFGESLHEFVNRKTIRGGKTALHVAAEQGCIEICLYLLQNGAIYNSVTKDNNRPSDLAKLHKIKNLFSKIDTLFQYVDAIDHNFEQLLQEGSEEEQIAYKCCRNIENKTLLECATSNKKLQILNSIINLLKNEKKN